MKYILTILVVFCVAILIAFGVSVSAEKSVVNSTNSSTSCSKEVVPQKPAIVKCEEPQKIIQNRYIYSEEESPSPHQNSEFISIDTERQKVLLPISNAHIGYLYATGSMLPTLNGRTKVIYVDPTLDNIKVGDIIYFQSGTEYQSNMIYHRVIAIPSEGVYETKGDNNGQPDSQLVSFSKVHGVVAAIVY